MGQKVFTTGTCEQPPPHRSIFFFALGKRGERTPKCDRHAYLRRSNLSERAKRKGTLLLNQPGIHFLIYWEDFLRRGEPKEKENQNLAEENEGEIPIILFGPNGDFLSRDA